MRDKLGFALVRDVVLAAPASKLRSRLRAWLARENPACMRHPHGFFVALVTRNEIEEWRFHFWPLGPRPITGMPAFIHTHDRVVDSRILQGQLTNVAYDVVPTGNEGRPLYEVAYAGDRYKAGTSNILRRTDTRVRSDVAHSETLVAGGSYRVASHTFHEAVVSEASATATLVCMHSQSPGTIKVVGLDGYPAELSFERQQVHADEFLEQILV